MKSGHLVILPLGHLFWHHKIDAHAEWGDQLSWFTAKPQGKW